MPYDDVYTNVLAGVAGMRSTSKELPITEADSFPKQWAFILCMAKAICLMCSRRAGKTDGLQLRTAKRGAENKKHRTLFVHHTRELAKQQFFLPLIDLLKRKGIPIHSVDHTALNITYGKQSFCQVVGCDKNKEIGKKLGFKWSDIIIDECQEFKDSILHRLITKTLAPTLIDFGGTLTLSGTPSEVEAGTWYNAITGKDLEGKEIIGDKGKYVQIRWTLLDNPHIKREEIVNTMSIAGYKVDLSNPENNDVLIKREIFGKQIIDRTKMLYCYSDEFNAWPVSGIPMLDSTAWRYAMGIDIGGANEGNDRDAVVVYGWMITDPEHLIWERESWEESELDSEAFCKMVLSTFNRWKPMVSVCGDTGGAGANKDLKWMSKRMGGLVMIPKPTSVELSTRLLNDEFRSGRMKVNPFGLISRDAKICTKKETYHSDIMAAARYAHHGAYHYLAKEPDDAHDGEKDLDTLVKERRWKQRKLERLKMADPFHAGGWLR
jgi:hypothetical protein